MNPGYQNIDKNYRRTIVVGDIHGCYEELLALLDVIKFDSNDLLIAVGDLVDRGPLSWKVAAFFKNTENAYSVLGNHERRVAGVIRGTSQPAWSQLHTLSKLDKDEHSEWASYFESLPAVIETPHAIVTHARLDPDKKITEQEPYHTCGVGSAGRGIEVDDAGTPRWFHRWRLNHDSDKPVCIGHIDYEKIELEPNELFALDTSGVKGQLLSAMVFPEATVVSVDCHNYYRESLDEWRETEFVEKLARLAAIPLHEITKLMNKEQCYEHDLALLNKFQLLIDESRLESRFAFLQQALLIKFGVLPAAGVKRGDYFKVIRSHFDTSNNQRLVGFLFSEESFQQKKLMKIFHKNSLDDVVSTISELELWLSESV